LTFGMRLAVFSDVHGHIERLSACLNDVARVGVDELWCLGDTVDGLRARRPELLVACVRAIDEVCAVKLAGNHDAWVLQDGALPEDAGAVLASWSVVARRDGVLAVHGSPHNPLMGHLSAERDVRAALARSPWWLCLHGHTHEAALWLHRRDGELEHQRRPASQKVGRRARAVACPGAISGPQPQWLLVDTASRRLTWHLLPTRST
jgi:predicted phosphodiesterase